MDHTSSESDYSMTEQG